MKERNERTRPEKRRERKGGRRLTTTATTTERECKDVRRMKRKMRAKAEGEAKAERVRASDEKCCLFSSSLPLLLLTVFPCFSFVVSCSCAVRSLLHSFSSLLSIPISISRSLHVRRSLVPRDSIAAAHCTRTSARISSLSSTLLIMSSLLFPLVCHSLSLVALSTRRRNVAFVSRSLRPRQGARGIAREKDRQWYTRRVSGSVRDGVTPLIIVC